jgi:hypothetical protein
MDFCKIMRLRVPITRFQEGQCSANEENYRTVLLALETGITQMTGVWLIS